MALSSQVSRHPNGHFVAEILFLQLLS